MFPPTRPATRATRRKTREVQVELIHNSRGSSTLRLKIETNSLAEEQVDDKSLRMEHKLSQRIGMRLFENLRVTS